MILRFTQGSPPWIAGIVSHWHDLSLGSAFRQEPIRSVRSSGDSYRDEARKLALNALTKLTAPTIVRNQIPGRPAESGFESRHGRAKASFSVAPRNSRERFIWMPKIHPIHAA